MMFRPMSWPKFKAELLNLYLPPLRAKRTYKKLEAVLNALDGYDLRSTSDLTVSVIARYVADRIGSVCPATVDCELRQVRIACGYAHASGYLRVNPFSVRKLKSWVKVPPATPKHHHSREDLRRVLELLARDVEQRQGWAQWRARRIHGITTLLCYTGLRRNECLYMHVDDLDIVNRTVWVRDRSGHGLKTIASGQPVPLPAAAVPVLEEWLRHRLQRPPGYRIPEHVPWLWPGARAVGPWIGGALGTKPLDRLRTLGERAGVQGLGFHSIRRSLATHLEGAGVSQPVITRILRHTTPATTLRHYQAADLENLNAVVGSFSY